jgi:hypothetical protein
MPWRDIMARLRDQDPNFAREIQRLQYWSVAIAVVAAVALGGGVLAYIVNGQQGDAITNVHNDVTKFERSACSTAQVNPKNRKAIAECQVVRAAAERTANENVNCIPFVRAGYVCPKPGSPLAEEHRTRKKTHGADAPAKPPVAPGRRNQAPEPSPPQADGTTSPTRPSRSSPPPGSTHPSRHERAPTDPSRPAPTSPHHSPTGSPAGRAPGASSPSATSSSSATAPSTPPVESQPPAPAPESSTPPPTSSPEGPVTGAVGGVVESVGGVVESTGSTVTGTVAGVTEKTCEATGLLCRK